MKQILKSKRNIALIIMAIIVGFVCLNNYKLNKQIKNEKGSYQELNIKYNQLVIDYNNQVKKIDELNSSHMQEIQSLNDQSNKLNEQIKSLVNNIDTLKEDLDKIKK